MCEDANRRTRVRPDPGKFAETGEHSAKRKDAERLEGDREQWCLYHGRGCVQRTGQAANEQARGDDTGEHESAHKENQPITRLGLGLPPPHQATHRKSGDESCQTVRRRVSSERAHRQAPGKAGDGVPCRYGDHAAPAQHNRRTKSEARSGGRAEQNALTEAQSATGQQ